MIKKLKLFLKKYGIYIIIILLAILRILLGDKIGIWYASDQGADDQLFAYYSSLKQHFLYPNYWSLIKLMGFPIFVNIVYITHLKYTFILSLIWIIDSILIYDIVTKITNNKLISFFSLVYVMFMPTAFESWLGTRMYRNSILVPFYIMVFLLMLNENILLLKDEKNYKFVINSIFLGLLFTFTYLIKEDGLWILACLLLCTLIYTIILIKKTKNHKNFIKYITFCITPFFIFAISINTYKGINNHFFGVYVTETKSNGELGKFVSNIYKIKSDYRTNNIWAPKDAIEKAFNASPTLSQHKELEESIYHSSWVMGDIDLHPIQGDFLTWTLRTSLLETGLWQNEKQINDFFKQVNTELDGSFKNGKLEKEDKRIQLLSSAGGRTFKEMLNLKPIITREYIGAVFLKDYKAGCLYGNNFDMPSTEIYIRKTKENYLISQESFNSEKNQEKNNIIINIIFKIYRIINPILLLLVIIEIIIYIFKIIISLITKKKISHQELLIFLTIICFICISIAYAFSIAWFSEFLFQEGINQTILNFYSPGIPALLIIPYIFSIILLTYKKKKSL